MNQNDRILRHLRDHGSIDPMTALRDYGIMRLASRINDLRNAGHAIDTVTVKDVNRYGEPVRYARYTLTWLK